SGRTTGHSLVPCLRDHAGGLRFGVHPVDRRRGRGLLEGVCAVRAGHAVYLDDRVPAPADSSAAWAAEHGDRGGDMVRVVHVDVRSGVAVVWAVVVVVVGAGRRGRCHSDPRVPVRELTPMTASESTGSPLTGHPRKGLDGLIHSPVRFSLLAALRNLEDVDFRFLADLLEVSDSTLSQTLTVLADAGLVTVRKEAAGRRTRTW